MQLFYNGGEKSPEVEMQFTNVITKILLKIKSIEEQATIQLGEKMAKEVLMPFASILNPITSVLNIDVSRLKKDKSKSSISIASGSYSV